MTYGNGQIETALAAACRIPAAELGAFKGKLRHLRALGIPKVEKVGSGSRVQFSRFDALTMRLALELSAFGAKPSSVAELTGAALKDLRKNDETEGGDDVFFIISEQPPGYRWTVAAGLEGVANVASKIAATSFVTINISRLIRGVDLGAWGINLRVVINVNCRFITQGKEYKTCQTKRKIWVFFGAPRRSATSFVRSLARPFTCWRPGSCQDAR